MSQIVLGAAPYQLGDPMDSLFSQLYEAFEEDPFLVSFDWDAFVSECQPFFDVHHDLPQHGVLHDQYFHNFNPLWRIHMKTPRLYDYAEQIWQLALRPVWDWESRHGDDRIHKGAAYYYWGVTAILRHDLERGFLLMHQARQEDMNSYNAAGGGPAWAFVTLEPLKTQVFQPKLSDVRNYLDQLLETYRTERGRTLDLDQFRSRFLSSGDFRDAVFLFVYVLFRVYALLIEAPRPITSSSFAGQVSVNLLFDLCLATEDVIKQTREQQINRRKSQKKGHGPIYFSDCVEELAIEAGLIRDYNRLRQATPSLSSKFESAIKSILGQAGTLEGDLLIALGFRNHGGHNVESYEFVHKQLPEIFQRIINTLFLSCEVFL